MKQISNQDTHYVLMILMHYLEISDESTKENRERRRRARLVISKLSKK